MRVALSPAVSRDHAENELPKTDSLIGNGLGCSSGVERRPFSGWMPTTIRLTDAARPVRQLHRWSYIIPDGSLLFGRIRSASPCRRHAAGSCASLNPARNASQAGASSSQPN